MNQPEAAGLKPTRHVFESQLDGLRLSYICWQPAKEQSTSSNSESVDGLGIEVLRIFVIHPGFGDHGMRYQELVNELSDGTTLFFALDARGHGKSEGIRGHASKFGDYAADLRQLIQSLKKQYPTAKVTLFGHSMGGAVALDFVLGQGNQQMIERLIVSSAALRIKLTPVVRIKKFIGDLLSRVLPSMVIDAGIDPNVLSHDQATVAAYKNDPDVHSKISFQMGSSFFAIGQEIMDRAAEITLPTYIFHGTADQLILPAGSEELYSRIGGADKHLELHQGLRHECFHESISERTKVIAKIREWYLH